MKNGIIALSLLLAFNLSAQGDLSPKDAQGRKHGEWRKLYDTKKIRYTGTFEHGIPVDTFRYNFPNGQISALNVFRGKTGNCYSFQYGDGKKLAAEGLFKQQQKDSVWTYYNAEGQVIGRETYKNGVKDGPVINYFSNGKIAESVNYVKDQKQGEWRQFYESGAPMAKGTYVDGSLHGEASYYYSSGKLRLRGSYIHGLMDGPWYYFDSNLKITKKEIWRRGRQIENKKEEKKD